MRTMTITEALVELKTLDSRIEKAINNSWIMIVKKCDKKDDPVIQEATKRCMSSYQSVTALIEERAKIKGAIVKSNAETMVSIGTQTMSVAEAIERKTSIEYEKDLKNTMARQLVDAVREVTAENKKVDIRLDGILEKVVGSDKSSVAENQESISKTFRLNNEVELLDPLNIKEIIQKMDDKISEFEANVDVALSISNANTVITI